LTDVWFIDWMVHCSPNSPSVNSKQPQSGYQHPSKIPLKFFVFLPNRFSNDAKRNQHNAWVVDAKW
jgi:hypothetical protein